MDFDNYLDSLSNRVLSKALSEEEKTNYTESVFESIKHVNEYGQEFWYARELQAALDYSQWRRFNETIERAKVACEKSSNDVKEHFAEVGKTIAFNL